MIGINELEVFFNIYFEKVTGMNLVTMHFEIEGVFECFATMTLKRTKICDEKIK
jgi:hypothetical protein